MALANFFDKAALGASQILTGFDRGAFRATLEAVLPELAFDAAATQSREARALLELATDLLARLYPAIRICALTGASAEYAEALKRRAASINPGIDFPEDRATTVSIVVGATEIRRDGVVLYAGSAGWTSHLSQDRPQPSGDARNPFGAGLAACLVAANLFRHVFRAALPAGALDSEVHLDVPTLAPNRPLAPVPRDLAGIDLGLVHLVGAGAIGQGAIWALSHLEGLAGELVVVDHEAVDQSNLQRYVLTDQKSPGTPKVTVAAAALEGTGLTVDPIRSTWGAYLAARGETRLERVLAAVDSGEARIALQASLPRRVLNAWTQPENLGVSRHDFLGEGPCLACLYMPEARGENLDARVMRELGLGPELLDTVRTLLVRGTPVGPDFIAQVAHRRGTEPTEELLALADQPLRSFCAKAVCGGLLLPLGNGSSLDTETPMAFQSVAAGILLAAELVLDVAGARPPQKEAVTTLNLLRSITGRFTTVEAKHPSGRCICQDADYRAVYAEKYVEPRHQLSTSVG